MCPSFEHQRLCAYLRHHNGCPELIHHYFPLEEQAEGARAGCFPEFLQQDGVADDGNVTDDERSVRLARLARLAHLHCAPRVVFPAT